jgi:hypothetical protein
VYPWVDDDAEADAVVVCIFNKRWENKKIQGKERYQKIESGNKKND